MKRTLIIAALLLACVLRAEAGVPKIDIYADMNHSSCELYDAVQPPVVFVYYFLSGVAGSFGVRFSAPRPACWLGATWAGDVAAQGNTVGTSQADWSVPFGVCLPGPVYVGKTAYLVSGQGVPCCQVKAMPGLEFVTLDCPFFDEIPLTAGQTVTINPDASCHCQQPLATEATTWGRVKSLYR